MPDPTRKRQRASSVTRERDLSRMISRLRVGMDVFLDAIPEGLGSTRQRATIRGWDPGNFVLLTRKANQSGAYLRKGQRCTLRFFTEGEVWGFQTQVLSNTVYVEDRALRVTWPLEAEYACVREHDRVRLDVPVTVRVEHERPGNGRLLDVSAGGCRACLKADYVVATPAYLTFSLPGGHGLEDQFALVRTRHAMRGGYDYGFEFSGLSEPDRAGLALFVARQRAGLRGEEIPHKQVVLCTMAPEDLTFARRMLHPRGYEVLHAKSLLDLGRLLHSGRTALLLVNSAQEPVDARHICLAVKEDEDTRDIPVAVYGEEGNAEREPEPSTYQKRLRLLQNEKDLLSCLQ